MDTLNFNEQNTDYIPEVFGWDKDDYDELVKLMGLSFIKNIKDTKAEISCTEMLKIFLDDEDIQSLFQTANDYLLLGFAFAKANELIKESLDKFIEAVEEKPRSKSATLEKLKRGLLKDRKGDMDIDDALDLIRSEIKGVKRGKK